MCDRIKVTLNFFSYYCSISTCIKYSKQDNTNFNLSLIKILCNTASYISWLNKILFKFVYLSRSASDLNYTVEYVLFKSLKVRRGGFNILRYFKTVSPPATLN